MEFHLTAMGRHLPYGITQCYLPPDTSERAPPSPRPVSRYSYGTCSNPSSTTTKTISCPDCTFFCCTSFCIRVLHSTEPTAFHGLFLYLEDRFIVKDKTEMWKCISVVAQKAFEMFLSIKAEKVSDTAQVSSRSLLHLYYSR